MTPSTPPQPDVSTSLSTLPVPAGTPDERGAMVQIQKWGGDAAYLEGCVGDTPPGSLEVAHATAALVVTVFAWVAPMLSVALLGILAASAVARVAGWPGLVGLVPRRPSWNVRVGAAGPTTRYVVVAAADRAPPRGEGRVLVAGAMVLVSLTAALARYLPDPAHPLPGAVILALAVVLTSRRPRESPTLDDFPEARSVAAALQSLTRALALGRTDVAGVVAGAGAVAAAGPLAFLDWWAVDRARCTVLWVDGGAPGALDRGGPVDRLRKAGWEVRVVPVPAGDRDGMGVDRAWLVG